MQFPQIALRQSNALIERIRFSEDESSPMVGHLLHEGFAQTLEDVHRDIRHNLDEVTPKREVLLYIYIFISISISIVYV